MTTRLHLVSASCNSNQVVVNSYIEGIVRLGMTFHNAIQVLERKNGQARKLETPANPRLIELKVIKIIVFDCEIAEYSGASGTIVLEGSGGSLLDWGDVLSES